jgi:hypothetical protein
MGKASQAAQEEFQRVRSLLLAEADERQAQLDHRTSIWQFQQQQAADDERTRTSEEQARVRAALTTASSVVTVRDDGPDAAVELEQMLVARAPLTEQLKWDRQQSNTVAAGMARLEVRSILMVFLGALALCSLGLSAAFALSSCVQFREHSVALGQPLSSNDTTLADNDCCSWSSCEAISKPGYLQFLQISFVVLCCLCVASGLRLSASDGTTWRVF